MNKSFLDMITAQKRAEIAAYGDRSPLAGQARALRENAPKFSLKTALSATGRVNIIAEIKRASPSRGMIRDGIDVTSLARSYQAGGAAAISILTEPEYFSGSLDDLSTARSAVGVSLLRKDFIVDATQIYEAALAGADAVLLIVAALNPAELGHLRRVAEDELGLDALVEVHTRDELKTASDAGATLIGVNNRNLRTLEVSLDVSRELIDQKGPGMLLIAESGISTIDEIRELRNMGYDGFLIGESLMRSSDPAATLRDLIS